MTARNRYYLSYSNGASLEPEYETYHTKQECLASFRRTAEDLDRFGQAIEASVHVAPKRAEIAEYPDYVLSLGPRGGLKVERC
jgi:hypothetical protein